MVKVFAALVVLVLPVLAFGAMRDMQGVSHWADGHGDCGDPQGTGPSGNGTRYIADFRIRTSVHIEDDQIQIHFIGFNGKEFFGPVSGTLDPDGNFDAKGAFPKYDEDYRYQGKLGHEGTEGVFTRLAHYNSADNSGPRCTATWQVTFKEGAVPTPVPAASPHPTTVSRPPAPSPAAKPGPKPSPSPVMSPQPNAGGNGFSLADILKGAGILAAAGAGLYTIAKQFKKKPPCRCTMTVKITGPNQLNVPRCAKPKAYTMTRQEAMRATLDVGDGSPRHYSAEATPACSGGGKIEIDSLAWSATKKDESHITVSVTVNAIRRCPGLPDAPLATTQTMEVAIGFLPCCGPDITDGYIAAINRIYLKIAKDKPLINSVFMLRWGDRMVYRPFAPGATFEDQCPSETCNDTVTLLGKCYDCFVGDNLLFGIVAGFIKLSVITLEAGGWFAKLVKQLSLTAHIASEELWRRGNAIGAEAREKLDKGETIAFDRAILANALREIPQHESCRPCEAKGPATAFIDFSREGW